MTAKSDEKKKAIKLRQEGKTYDDILKEVPVSRSTLSLWLREVGLSKRQKQNISVRRYNAQLKGALARRNFRLKNSKELFQTSITQIDKLSKREKLLVGAALYWAEGAKEKPHNVSQGVDFGNTDPCMIKFFVHWLQNNLGVSSDDITFKLYIHVNHKHRLKEVKQFWQDVTPVPSFEISYVYFKRHNPKTLRKKTDKETYYGTLRVTVARSTNLQRKIQGMIYGITEQPCPVV